jgi:hypothetical protein
MQALQLLLPEPLERLQADLEVLADALPIEVACLRRLPAQRGHWQIANCKQASRIDHPRRPTASPVRAGGLRPPLTPSIRDTTYPVPPAEGTAQE